MKSTLCNLCDVTLEKRGIKGIVELRNYAGILYIFIICKKKLLLSINAL